MLSQPMAGKTDDEIFVRDGKMPEDVESNMMRQSLMALKSSMKYRRR